MRNSILLVILLSGLNANAGDGIGNGGDIVVCTNHSFPHGSNVELLDYYEAKKIGRVLDIEAGANSEEEILDNAVQKVKQKDYWRGVDLEACVAAFDSETNYQHNVTLPDIPDSDHVSLPDSCHPEQIAVQRHPKEMDGGYRYIIDNDLYPLLNPLQKAGLKLHECVYRQALEFNALNSKGTRYLNGLIASSAYSTVSQNEYEQLLVLAGFLTSTLNGFESAIATRKYEIYRGLNMLWTRSFSARGGEYVGNAARLKLPNHSLPLRATFVRYYPNGTPEYLNNFDTQTEPKNYAFTDPAFGFVHVLGDYGGGIFFYENGTVKQLNFLTTNVGTFKLANVSLTIPALNASAELDRYENGNMRSLKIRSGPGLPASISVSGDTLNGTTSILDWNENGEVIRAFMKNLEPLIIRTAAGLTVEVGSNSEGNAVIKANSAGLTQAYVTKAFKAKTLNSKTNQCGTRVVSLGAGYYRFHSSGCVEAIKNRWEIP